jgi:MYXO-CTERM domain-containing protein
MPVPTGSARFVNTIGMVRVSRKSASTEGVLPANITSGLRSMNSFAIACICGLVAASPASHAATITLDLSTAVFTGGAGTIAGGDRIKFDPNTAGETATFTIPSVPGTQYAISVTGQSDQSSSFLQFFIDADGPGAGGFAQLGGNINFGSGFNTITLPAFTDLGTSDFFRIINGGTGNSEAQISNITVTAVPGPIAGTGIPALLGLVGLWAARRRRQKLAPL